MATTLRFCACCVLPALVSLGLAVRHAPAADPLALASPDGAVQLELRSNDDSLQFSVSFRGRPVIEPSPLTIHLDQADITRRVRFGEAERYERDETYPWRGVHSRAVDRCRGVKLPLTHPQTGTRYILEARAFNDGIAFRHVIAAADRPRVPDEFTTFRLPDGCTVWYHDLEGHYEDVHEQDDVADVSAAEWVAPPLTIKLPDAAGYAAITEAAVANYAGMALQADGRRGFQVRLGHAHHVSYPFRLRYKEDVERLAQPASIAGEITSPWRVVIVGADLNALVNSDVIPSLCPPPDPRLFPDGLETEWIKPGRAVWRYLDGGDNSFEGMREFCRWAGELGFEYNILEGFWRRWSDDQLRDLAAYGRQHGVGLWLWQHSKELRDPEQRRAFFQRCADVGAVGVKLDFFDHEAKEVIDHYEVLLRAAAEHKLLVNFHGSNKPGGESRTWPNELVRESVRGMEASKLQTRARHDATLPFTRYLAGPGDYTPVHFGARRADTTWAHQVATAVVFTAPLLTYAAHPRTILEHPCAPLIRSIPATWDETRVLPPSAIGEVAVFARRRGETWFLAVVNGPEARTIHVPLTFLDEGRCRSLEIADNASDPAAVQVSESAVQSTQTVPVELSSGGGFVARLTRE
jgi:alpha-glucosidase